MVKKGEGVGQKDHFQPQGGRGKVLSNEVLNFDFGQGTAKILEVKNWRLKKLFVNSAGPGHIGVN